MSVNKRVFGTPIADDIADKLNARQAVTDNLEPGQSLEGIEVSNYDYANRLPFVRMWTSVKIIEKADVENDEQATKVMLADLNLDETGGTVPLYKLRQEKANQLGTTVDMTNVKELKDKKTGQTTGYLIRGSKRDQVPFTRQIYEIGNHNYLKNYGESVPNEPINTYNSEGVPVSLSSPFTNESETNPLMKPQSGIKSVSSETEGALGLIKKTTVSFVVHNFYDFDNIFSKYFLAPGAQIFVDFGFSNISNLYRPEELIDYSQFKKGGVQEYLYGEPTDDDFKSIGFVTKNLGDVEVLQGIVTDYSAKIRQDGGVECSVTLTSKNSALLSFATDDDVVMRVKSILTRGVLYLGLRAIVSSGEKVTDDGVGDSDRDLKQLMSTPNADASSDTIDTYNQNILLLAEQELSGRSGPVGNAIRTGVFVENLNADNTFITWGLFEDLILNSQFGFGKDNKDIVEGKNLQVKINSSNAYTRWTTLTKEKQHVLMAVPEDIPTFLYPEWWGKFDPNKKEAAGSYSYQSDKLPVIPEIDEKGKVVSTKSYENEKLSFNIDKLIGRIPIREVFINVDMIVKAFESSSDVKKVIEEILSKLNEDGRGLFDWKMKQGETDAEIEIIDVNYTIASENEKINIQENPFFTFKVQSPNSMIKDYNLDFKIPSGNVGNMFAIQGMGSGDTIFTTNKSVKDAIATGVLDKDLLKIIYEPDLGNYRAKNLLNEPKVDSETFNVFKSVDNLFDNNVYKISTTERPNIIKNQSYDTFAGITYDIDFQTDLTDKRAVTKDSEQQPKLTSEEIIKTSNETLEAAGYKIAKTFKEYYKYKINSAMDDKIPNLLPYNLSLTILGIASINVGDTFKVDYLPNRYQESTYLQVTKVSHEVGPGGWYTSLDTVFRLLPYKSNDVNDKLHKDKIRLSPSAIISLPCEDQIEVDAGYMSWGNDLKLADLASYMTDITIDYGLDWKFDFAVHFKMAKQLEGEIKNESGKIKNSRGNFFADFPSDSKRNTALKSINKGTWYTSNGNGLGHSYISSELPGNSKVKPPDLQLIPNHYYTMMVAGDKIAVLYYGKTLTDKNKFYDNTYKFFQQYYGMNGKGINEKIGETLESAGETIGDFIEDLIY